MAIEPTQFQVQPMFDPLSLMRQRTQRRSPILDAFMATLPQMVMNRVGRRQGRDSPTGFDMMSMHLQANRIADQFANRATRATSGMNFFDQTFRF